MPAKPKIPPPSKRHAKLRTSADLIPDPENPREIEDENLEGLQVSMAEFGDLSGIVFNSRTGQLVAGHQRMSGIRKKFGDLPIEREGERAWIRIPGGKIFAIRLVDWDAPTQRAANIAANNPYIAGHFTDSLRPQLEEIRARNQALFDSLRLAPMVMPARGMDTGAARATLGEKFLVPPFSILDSRQGYWQDRKRAWKGLGIQSEVGRGENLLKHNENLVADRMRPKGSSRAGLTQR
jgi:hypothetical protein